MLLLTTDELLCTFYIVASSVKKYTHELWFKGRTANPVTYCHENVNHLIVNKLDVAFQKR